MEDDFWQDELLCDETPCGGDSDNGGDSGNPSGGCLPGQFEQPDGSCMWPY